MSLTRSLITQQHRPILDQLLVRLSLRQGQPPAQQKRNFFATMSGEVIKSIKRAALEDDITASEILEEAAKDWLARRAGKHGSKGRS